MYSDHNTGLYLFSALLQANAAILAIVGIFIVFKIQTIHSFIEKTRQTTFRFAGHDENLKVIDFDELSLPEKKEFVKSLPQNGQSYLPFLRRELPYHEELIE